MITFEQLCQMIQNIATQYGLTSHDLIGNSSLKTWMRNENIPASLNEDELDELEEELRLYGIFGGKSKAFNS